MEELNDKIQKAFNRDFIGDYIFSEEELAEINSRASVLLRAYYWDRLQLPITLSDERLIFIALVNAVKNWDSDSNTFWEQVHLKLLGSSYFDSQKIDNFIRQIINSLGNRDLILYLNGSVKKYYITVLAHAFAPIVSSFSFFELCWDVYCKDLSMTYLAGDEVFQMVANELKRKFSNEQDDDADFKLGSKAYSLRVALKRLAIEKTDKFTSLIDKTIKLIDSALNNDFSDASSYYNAIFYEWWIRKEKDLGVTKIRRLNSEKAVSSYDKIKPKYKIVDGRAVLSIPPIRLKNNFEYYPVIEVYDGENIVFNSDMYTVGTGLTMATKQVNIYLNNLNLISLDEIKLIITHCGEEIYNSKELLKREFVLFKDGIEIFNRECSPGNYNLLLYNFDLLLQYPENLKTLSSNMHMFHANDGDILYSNFRTVLFINDSQSKDIFLIKNAHQDVLFRFNNEDYDVIENDLYICIRSGKDRNDYGVKFGDTYFKLNDFTGTENGEVIRYCLTDIISTGEPQKITIFKFSNNKVIYGINVIKFNELKIIYDKPLYYDTGNKGEIRFVTNKFDRAVTFDINQEEISLAFNGGELIFEPPIFKWSIDGKWNTKSNLNGIWYKEIGNSTELKISCPAGLEYNIACSINIPLQATDVGGVFKLGQVIYSNLDTASEIIVFANLKDRKIPICSIYLKESFRTDPCVIVDNALIWSPEDSYIGDIDSKFKIQVCKDSSVLMEQETYLTDKSIDLKSIPDGYFDVSVILKTKSFLRKEQQLWKKRIAKGDPDEFRFNNAVLEFEKIMLTNSSTLTSIKKFYVDKIKLVRKEEGRLFYTGELFIDSHGKKIYLNTMQNDNRINERINPIRLELMNDRACWIVAGYNEQDWYDYLGEFTLDGFNQISNKNKGTKGIDYFVFNKRYKNV